MFSSKWWNNEASDIKLVYLYSAIKMMHGPINIRCIKLCLNAIVNFIQTLYVPWKMILTDWQTAAPLFVEGLYFHIIHFTHVAHKIMFTPSEVTCKIQRLYNSLWVLDMQLSAVSYRVATVLPKSVSQFQTRHVFLQHRFSIKTNGALIKSFVLFPLHRQNELTFVNDWCGLVQNTHYVAQCRHVIHFSFRNIR